MTCAMQALPNISLDPLCGLLMIPSDNTAFTTKFFTPSVSQSFSEQSIIVLE